MENSDKEYKNIFKSSKYLVPAITMFICLSIATGIVVITKFLMGSKKEDISIATNVAEEAFYNKKYDASIKEYEELQKEDQWPIWNVKIAEIYSTEGEFVKSNEILQKSYETRNKILDTKDQEKETVEDKDKELINDIVLTYLMNGENKKSIEYGDMFLKDYPNDKNLLKTMFTVYIINGQKDKAKEVLGSYQVDQDDADDLAVLARMNMLIDNFDKGLALLKDAWYKDKNEIKILDVITQISQNNKSDILNKISTLQKKNPNELVYKIWMAKIYSLNKDTSKNANKLISELENKDVGDISLNLIKVNVYKNTGEMEKAEEVLNSIASNNSDSFIGYYAAAYEELAEGKYKDAFINAQRSVICNRNYIENYTSLIPEIMIKQNKANEIEPYFMTALYNEPFNNSIMIKIAEYYKNIVKDSTKALYYYNLASKINPSDAEIYYNMASIKINNQRVDEAMELLKKSILLNGKVAKYHRALGSLYLSEGKNDYAIKEIRSAYDIDKNDVLTLNNAACYYIIAEGDLDRGKVNLNASYEGINDKISEDDKTKITENYNRVKALSGEDNKKSTSKLTLSDLKLFY